MSVATGLLALGTGIAYTLLGAITAYDLARHRRVRGHSHFGFGFLLMAATCGPHHLVHAVHLLFEGHHASAPLLAALAIGFPPGAAFTYLRMEAMFGGRGDRFVAGTPLHVAILPVAVATAAGAIAVQAGQIAPVPAGGWAWAGLLANVFLAAAYMVTGGIVIRTQIARRPGLGGWSVSGPRWAACSDLRPQPPDRRPHHPRGVAHADVRPPRRPRRRLLPVGRLPAQPQLAERLEPPPARGPRHAPGRPAPWAA